MNEDHAIVIVAALIQRLGGSVILSEKEIMDAMDLNLYRTDGFNFSGGIKFSIEDNTIVQGELV